MTKVGMKILAAEAKEAETDKRTESEVYCAVQKEKLLCGVD